MRAIQLVFLVLLVLMARSANAESKQQPPNILFLFSDDQRADTIGALGNSLIKTPNIDRLVRRGTYFTHAYCMGSIHGAVCVPSRAMLMSGRSMYRVSMQLDKGEVTFPEWLGEHGYLTFGTGKWHNGETSFARSFQQGRTVMFGGMSDHSKVPIVDMNADKSITEKREAGFSSTIFADAAVQFLEQYDGSKPFMCYVSFTAPHDPRMPPEEFAEMYKDELPPLPGNFLPQHPFNTQQMTVRDEQLAGWPRTEQVVREQLADYYGMISHMDQQIGRILDTLADRKLDENTLVVFASDHGLAMGSHGLLGKQSLYEHSMNSPMLVAGPGIPQAKTVDELVYLFDLYPTMCDFAGVPAPDGLDGVSLTKVITGGQRGIRSSMYTMYADRIRAVRDRRWKLVRWPQIDRTQLFDLEADPLELLDLSGQAEQANRLERMMELIRQWQTKTDDQHPLVVDNPISDQIDLSDFQRKPDRWQPKWIVKKYFGDTGNATDSEPDK